MWRKAPLWALSSTKLPWQFLDHGHSLQVPKVEQPWGAIPDCKGGNSSLCEIHGLWFLTISRSHRAALRSASAYAKWERNSSQKALVEGNLKSVSSLSLTLLVPFTKTLFVFLHCLGALTAFLGKSLCILYFSVVKWNMFYCGLNITLPPDI